MLPAKEQSLSGLDLARLEHFLASSACGREAMTLSRAHGFMTAAISGPETVLPGEWIRLALDEPVFEDAGQAEDMLGLMMRLYQEIAANLPKRGEFRPIFEQQNNELGEHIVSADEWCRGYVSGMTLSGDIWASQSDNGLGALLAPIFILVRPGDEEEKALRAQRYEALCALIPGAAEDIYHYWKACRNHGR
jgi:uncharacterized protein